MPANQLPAADAAAFCAKPGKICSGKRRRQAAFAPGHRPLPSIIYLFVRTSADGRDSGRQKISMPVPFSLP
jgi:hypothetical protein